MDHCTYRQDNNVETQLRESLQLHTCTLDSIERRYPFSISPTRDNYGRYGHLHPTGLLQNNMNLRFGKVYQLIHVTTYDIITPTPVRLHNLD